MNHANIWTVAPWVSNSFPIIRIVLLVLMVLFSIAMIIVVFFQPSNSNGMGAITGQSDTYYSKNKSKTVEGAMKRLTIILGIALFVISLLFFISVAIYAG